MKMVTGSGLRIIAFFLPGQVTGQFHEPGNTKMYHQSTKDGTGIIHYHAQQDPSEIRTDTFAKRLSKMYSAIEAGHRQDCLWTNIFCKSNDQKTPEEKFNGNKIAAIG